MGCCGKGKDDKPRVSHDRTAPDFALRRMSFCGICKHNDRGVCEIVKQRNHDKEASIEIGVLMPEAWCPIGKWGIHTKRQRKPGERPVCFWCKRYHDTDHEICPWCRSQLASQHRNAQKGIGGNAWGSPYDTRLHEVRKRPFTGPAVRHLHYFLYPRFRESTQYHMDRLRQAADIFNGKRAVCVAVDRNTMEKEFRSQIEELFTDIYYADNSGELRELVGFVDTLKIVLEQDENHAICFAHGKGQQPHTERSEVIRKWTDAAYETCVMNWDDVEQAFEEGFPVSGAFRSVGAFRATAYKWHYSGAFWWGRSAAIAENPNWQQTCRRWWGSESYVGRHWWPDEGHCTFGNHTGGGSLYDASTWRVLDKELERWRRERSTGKVSASNVGV